ncbi:7392_t:CDS:2, partial [Scutellospora calospora]
SSTHIIDLHLISSISKYIVPTPAFMWSFGKYFHQVMRHPVEIWGNHYPRNKFMLNLYLIAVLTLQIESAFLSNESTKSFMYNIIEQLLEDLNSYCECQIPINSANTINLKLFPTYRNPPPVYDYQVPICTVNLKAWMVAKSINGIHHVKKIAELADVDYGLARKCMEHLLYYGCIIMVDIFQSDITKVIEDETIQSECLSYVRKRGKIPPLFAKLFSLYCQLKHGSTLKEWIQENKEVTSLNIDIR